MSKEKRLFLLRISRSYLFLFHRLFATNLNQTFLTESKRPNYFCATGMLLSFERDVFTCWKPLVNRWECCVGDNSICRARERMRDFFLGSKAEMITVVLVVLNTFCMAMEQEPKTERLNNFLINSNYVNKIIINSKH